MYWRPASIQDGQAPGDATVLERFFRNNLVISLWIEKNSIFGISEFSTYVYMHIFISENGQA